MIERKDWEDAYDLLVYITSKIAVLEQGYRDGLLQDKARGITFYDDRIQAISTGSGSSDLVQSNLRNHSINDYSFIRDTLHRETKINIHLLYVPCDNLRLGRDVINNFDYSEENIFQQSLVLPKEVVADLEFICFLRNKKFSETLVLKRNAYSIEGLLMIKETVEKALCYLSEQK